MTKEVEDLIRNKAYYELSKGERESVAEYAQNEEEYNNMQWFLTGTTTAFGSAKVEASPGLKKGVMAHLTESKKKKGFWLNSVGVFMLPTNKKFYQKPLFQLGVAAALLVGFLFVINPGTNENGLAVLDQSNDNPIELNEQNESQKLEDDQRELNPAESGNNLTDEELTDQLTEVAEEMDEVDELMELEEISEDLVIDASPAAPAMEDNYTSTGATATFTAPLADSYQTDVVEDETTYSFDFGETVEVNADEIVMVEKIEENKDIDKALKSDEADTKERTNRIRTSSLRSEAKKKELNAINKSVESEPGISLDDEGVDAPEAASSGSGAINNDWIKPKSMHINKTKELNNLFFIEK